MDEIDNFLYFCLKMYYRTYTDQIFQNGFIFKQFWNNDGFVFLEQGKRNLFICHAGDCSLGCFQGDPVIFQRQRLIPRFVHLFHSERERSICQVGFQQRSFADPGTSLVNSGGEFFCHIFCLLSLDIGGIMTVKGTVSVKIHAAGGRQMFAL